MSLNITKESNGLLVLNITGIFTNQDFKSLEKSFHDLHVNDSKINCLINCQKFAGWGKEGDWGDLTFMYEIDPLINKIAVVSQEKWRDEMLMFLGAGRRQAIV